ncbi:MAG: helix-turn-helix domain-containing protein [Deltaproteobacteria bacterium]|nr:helix-turn-helix domain-containing protein [Deltaproteobacteria bacterium]
MRGRPKSKLILHDEERRVLLGWTQKPPGAGQAAVRARVVLLCADGKDNKTVASETGVGEQTVGKWRRRFVTQRLRGLGDQPRSGAPPTLKVADVERAVVLTLARSPSGAPWTTRSLAQTLGLSQSAVSRIWRAFGLQLNSAELPFGDDVRDILGTFVGAPERAVVVVTGRIQRKQSILHQLRQDAPLITMTPDGGPVSEFREFLGSVARFVPEDQDVYLVVSSCGGHAGTLWHWLESDPRHHLHLLHSDEQWQELVNRWFARLTGAPLAGDRSLDAVVPSFSRYVSLQQYEEPLRQRNQKPPGSR